MLCMGLALLAEVKRDWKVKAGGDEGRKDSGITPIKNNKISRNLQLSEFHLEKSTFRVLKENRDKLIKEF